MNNTRLFFLIAVILLPACSKPVATASAEQQAVSRKQIPHDPNIAAIYTRSCKSCHTVAATRAPLTGDATAWAPRMEKGKDVLVESVVNGYGGMPPFGLCMDCDAEQFEALIEFMATPAEEK